MPRENDMDETGRGYPREGSDMFTKLTKGTQIYFINPYNNTVLEISNIIGIKLEGIYMLININSDTNDKAYSILTKLFSIIKKRVDILDFPFEIEDIPPFSFCMGWPDGTVAPTANSDGTFDQTAVARTMYYFDGYTNNITSSIISIQILPDYYHNANQPNWVCHMNAEII